MNRNVIIIGASGFGKLTADIVLNSRDNLIGFLDDNPDLSEFFHKPILGKTTDFKNFLNCEFIVSIGNADTREKIVNMMGNVKWYTAIHPNAIISPFDVAIGEGSVILPGAIIDPGVTIGKHSLINCNAVVAHDSIIGNFCHISVGTNVAGTVIVGDKTWVGIGSSVNNNLSICGGCMIGAGAVVVKDIKEPGTYVGLPAKKIR